MESLPPEVLPMRTPSVPQAKEELMEIVDFLKVRAARSV